MEVESAGHRLFDRSQEYDAELNQGLGLYGEDKHFFLAARVDDLQKQLGATRPRSILDFGCGFGDSSQHLAGVYPEARVLGIDTSDQALEHATRAHGSQRVQFRPVADFEAAEEFDLCYVNGVFHHIEPEERISTLEVLRRALVPGGRLALFENNPWNPGTRILMKRLSFDQDAIPINPREARQLLRRGGFAECGSARFLFWFPRALAPLRFLEPWLCGVPLGAQYCLLATRS